MVIAWRHAAFLWFTEQASWMVARTFSFLCFRLAEIGCLWVYMGRPWNQSCDIPRVTVDSWKAVLRSFLDLWPLVSLRFNKGTKKWSKWYLHGSTVGISTWSQLVLLSVAKVLPLPPAAGASEGLWVCVHCAERNPKNIDTDGSENGCLTRSLHVLTLRCFVGEVWTPTKQKGL